MGNHRAERRGMRRGPSETTHVRYAGKRVAGRSDTPIIELTTTPAGTTLTEALTEAPPVVTTPDLLDPEAFGLEVEVRKVEDEPAARLDHTTDFGDREATAHLPLVAPPGKRRAVKQPSPRRRRLLPSVPAAVGVAALAVSIGGAVLTGGDDADQTPTGKRSVVAASALSGESGAGSVRPRGSVVSRDSSRTALGDATDAKLQKSAEAKNAQRNTALQKLSAQAEAQAQKIKRNQWVLPVSGYRLTARFAESSGLWASTHTGLDFAAPSGTPLVAVANATVTSTGYDGAYGNKTVLTLEDGTEIWYCHQTSIDVSVGQKVNAGQRIGTVGSTGNSTGPHLHLEVRPGGGDPVDPYSHLAHHGVQP